MQTKTALPASPAADKILGLSDVVRATNTSKATIYVWMKAGMFPRQRKMGTRKVGWLASDVDAWLKSLAVAA